MIEPEYSPETNYVSDERKRTSDVERNLNTERVLKQLEAGRARTAAEMAREVGVSQHTSYARKAKYGGMEVNEAEELRALREENQQLKKRLADRVRAFCRRRGTSEHSFYQWRKAQPVDQILPNRLSIAPPREPQLTPRTQQAAQPEMRSAPIKLLLCVVVGLDSFPGTHKLGQAHDQSRRSRNEGAPCQLGWEKRRSLARPPR